MKREDLIVCLGYGGWRGSTGRPTSRAELGDQERGSEGRIEFRAIMEIQNVSPVIEQSFKQLRKS